jgi:hypothetical protein
MSSRDEVCIFFLRKGVWDVAFDDEGAGGLNHGQYDALPPDAITILELLSSLFI